MAKEQRNIPFYQPDITDEEISEVIQTLKSGWITTGPKTKRFEQMIAEYSGVKKAACLSSATAAMELTLRILGICPGDEVITTAYTYTATAAAIFHVGAKIILIDTAPESYEMDYSKLADVITKRTKAIISVDLAGKMCDYAAIYRAVNSKKAIFKANGILQETLNRIAVIADAAHAFGAERSGQRSGQAADFTCFSFHAVKNITTAEGGAVVWRNDLGFDEEWLYEQYMLYSLHGQSKDAYAKAQKGAWEYDVILPAYKCNMTDVLASIGLIQMKRYKCLLQKRCELIRSYNDALSSLGAEPFVHYGKGFASSGHLYLIRIPEMDEAGRNKMIFEMASKGVTANVHYKPLPMLTAYKRLGFSIQDYPNAYNTYRNEITLPLYPYLNAEDVGYVAACLKTAWDDVRNGR